VYVMPLLLISMPYIVMLLKPKPSNRELITTIKMLTDENKILRKRNAELLSELRRK
jgi:hypothetical protein